MNDVIQCGPEDVASAPHEVGGLRAGSVFGDDDLHAIVDVLREGSEHDVERSRPRIRRDDHAELDSRPRSDERHGRSVAAPRLESG